MPKFISMYNQMVKEHKPLFEEFKKIHEAYKLDRQKNAAEFNQVGAEVVAVVREYEQRLCGGMERGQFGKYSDKVAEKFWDRVKKDYSHIELVGVEIIQK